MNAILVAFEISGVILLLLLFGTFALAGARTLWEKPDSRDWKVAVATVAFWILAAIQVGILISKIA